MSRVPFDSRTPRSGAAPAARGHIQTTVQGLEQGRQTARQRPLPDVARSLLVDALHERATQGDLIDARAVSDAWLAARASFGVDTEPRGDKKVELGSQPWRFLGARVLGLGGPIAKAQLCAIQRQRAQPLQLPAASRLTWNVGESKHVVDIAREAFGASRALDFITLWRSWGGYPVGGPGDQSTTRCAQQRTFTRLPWKDKLDTDDMKRVLHGEVLIMENPHSKQLDFVAREHNTLDVLLAAWALGRPMPTKVLHFDRHSDYITEADAGTTGRRYLAGAPQAAAWWSLLDVIQRADGDPLANPTRDVAFVTYLSPRQDEREDRVLNFGRSSPIPPRERQWQRVAEGLRNAPADFVSYDLDLSMPSHQMNGTKSMLRDPDFQRAMQGATTRLFVVSPEFSGGGDLIKNAHAVHSPATYARVLNVIRRAAATGGRPSV